MKHRKKGRKIYTYHAKNRRVFSSYHPMRTALGTVFLLLLIAVLGLVGYNIVGPVVTRFRLEESSPTTTPQPYFIEAQQTEVTLAANAEESVTTVTETQSVVTTAVTTAPAPVNTRFPAEMQVACKVPEDALRDLDSVEKAAKTASEQGYSALILPLKPNTGKLQYASGVEQAKTCGATDDSRLTLREITNAAARYQMLCIAQFSTLDDQTYSNYFMEGSYRFDNGNTRWLDNKPEEGGKPWMNPFDAACVDYLSALAGEIGKSGFAGMICTDTVFPHFFQSDADLLGAHVMDPSQRSDALRNLIGRISQEAPNSGLYATLDGVAAGTEEAFTAAGTNVSTLYIGINPSAFSEPFTINEIRFDPGTLEYRDKFELLLQAAKLAAGDKLMIPCLSGTEMTPLEIDIAAAVLAEYGCMNMYIL